MKRDEIAKKNGFDYDWGFANNAYSKNIGGIKLVILQTGYDSRVWRLYYSNSRFSSVKENEEIFRGTFAKCIKEVKKIYRA